MIAAQNMGTYLQKGRKVYAHNLKIDQDFIAVDLTTASTY
jgi:hypothetical protein